MTTRREFIATAAAGAGAFALTPPSVWAKPDEKKPPMRFIFLHRGNGLYPSVLVPPSFSKGDAEKEAKKEPLNLDLGKHDLPEWMSPLAADADVTLSVAVDAPSPFDSHLSTFALVETLVAAVVERLGQRPRDRLAAYDKLWEHQSFVYREREGEGEEAP